MPTYFDKENLYGVKVTIYPKNRFIRHKLIKNYLSPPIWVGKKIRLIIRFEKLNDFTEATNQNFWSEKAILEKLSNNIRNVDNITLLNAETVYEKEIDSQFISSEGDVEYKISSRYFPANSFYEKQAVPLYTANIKSNDWSMYGLKMSVLGGLLVAAIIALANWVLKL